MSAIDVFLHEIIDYAGLFPPARLDLPTALGNYDFYRRHSRSALLGRFCLPLDRLAPTGPLPRRITLICRGEDVALPPLPPEVETIEIAGTLAQPTRPFVFHEIDWHGDFEARMPANGGVKLRTGGLTAEAFPSPEIVERFLLAAAARRLPIKFTAGLHEPVPYVDPLTGARHHGFLNIFAAAFAAYSGHTDLAGLIGQASAADFRFTESGFHAGPLFFSVADVARLRRDWVISFGSCSFLEPIEHLERHGYLQPE